MRFLNIFSKIHKIDIPQSLSKNFSRMKNEKVKDAITSYSSAFLRTKDPQLIPFYQDNLALMDDLVIKLKMCEDTVISAEVEKLILSTKKQTTTNAYNTLRKAEGLLDSVNVANGKYSNLFDAQHPFGNLMPLNERSAKIQKAKTDSKNKFSSQLSDCFRIK